ncbi:ferredoxin [Gordonia sp. (in: high G+C Gram-positive bacteria)]
MLTIDRVACAGHGMCYATAPELIDCDEEGDPILPDRQLTEEESARARDAVSACPERALTLVTAFA